MDTLKDLQKSTEYAIKSVMEFRQSVADTPPATGQYKRAKQHTLTVLDDLLNQIRGTNNLIPQVLKTIQDIIDSAKTDSTQEGA